MSTDNTSSDSQFKLVPAYGSSSDSKSTAESSHMVTYQDLVRNSDLFWDKLRAFLGYSDTTLKIPVVGGNSLDLHRLFVEVTSRGGIEKVIKDRKCREVIRKFNFKTSITNAAFVLRKYYLRMLFEFEHVYFFQEPISSFWAREEAVKRLIEKPANRDQSTHKLQPGSSVDGIIDGKFENGYFVTMKMGSEELKGVLYHIPQAPPETPRRKKKSKTSRTDSSRPKAHRSGYNFFFAEQYQRLKADFAGQERSLIKEIGNLWSNLSVSDRQVYQERGHEDVERYNAEMSEYRSLIESRAAETVAAPAIAAATDASETDASATASDATH